MLYDYSIFFEKIKKGKYMYRYSPLFSKYGYIVSYKEKQILLSDAMSLMENTVKFTKLLYIPLFLWGIKYGIIALVILSYFIYKLRKKQNRIIKDKEKVVCGRLTFLKICRLQVESMGFDYVLQNSIAALGCLLFCSYCLVYEFSEASIKIKMFFACFTVFTALGLIMAFTQVYYLIKLIKVELEQEEREEREILNKANINTSNEIQEII